MIEPLTNKPSHTGLTLGLLLKKTLGIRLVAQNPQPNLILACEVPPNHPLILGVQFH
jgi:hypothetical protein